VVQRLLSSIEKEITVALKDERFSDAKRYYTLANDIYRNAHGTLREGIYDEMIRLREEMIAVTEAQLSLIEEDE